MSLFVLPRSFHVNSAGLPYGLAKLYHYRAGTLTTLPLYTTEALGVQHANPIVADANGLFPAIYTDPTSAYDLRAILKTSADVTIYDEDNISIASLGSSDLLPFQDNAFSLGSFSPARRWLDLYLSRAVRIKSNAYQSTIQNATLTGDRVITLSDADYTLGATQINTQNANYTFLVSDIGKTIYHDSASAHTYTIPTDAGASLPIGAVIEIENAGIGTISLSPAGGVTLYTNANSPGALAVYRNQRARAKKVAANTWTVFEKLSIISGSFTGTLTGCTTSPTQQILYSIIGDKVSLVMSGSLSAVSNTTSMTITGLPSAIQTAGATLWPCALIDNGVDRLGIASVNVGVISFMNTSATGALSLTGFTNSGTKGIASTFTLTYAI